jgi:hypothetical protein
MTTGVPARPTATGRGTDDPRQARRRVMASVVRTAVVTLTVLAIYTSAPLDRRPADAIALRLLVELVALVFVLVWQIRSVGRSPNPVLRGVESLVVSVPLLVLTFAATYAVVDHNSPGSFTETLSRLDAAYLSVTILATVGFGDITPVSDVARSLVMAQMLVDLAFVGLVAKVLVGAVRRRRDEMQSVAATSAEAEVERP